MASIELRASAWGDGSGGRVPTRYRADRESEMSQQNVDLVRGGENFDEFTCTVVEAEDQGDTVVVTARFKGRNKSGAELDAQAEHVWEVRDGKLARHQSTVDREAWTKGWS